VVKVLALVGYAVYLAHVGLLMLILPWSDSWVQILTWLPPRAGVIFASPAIRGGISGLGLLHLGLILAEIGAFPRSERSRRPVSPQ